MGNLTLRDWDFPPNVLCLVLVAPDDGKTEGHAPDVYEPIEDQVQCGDTVNPVLKIETEEYRKAALQTLFQTMLHLLMTGKIRVKELNSAEE